MKTTRLLPLLTQLPFLNTESCFMRNLIRFPRIIVKLMVILFTILNIHACITFVPLLIVCL
ncbi:hypothetical protein HanPSC8_Chr08g0313221 [Helianthus annuus]|nr:hypothetical protein HanPSC8_Chr08g0313221 [Helianthus annuus]